MSHNFSGTRREPTHLTPPRQQLSTVLVSLTENTMHWQITPQTHDQLPMQTKTHQERQEEAGGGNQRVQTCLARAGEAEGSVELASWTPWVVARVSIHPSHNWWAGAATSQFTPLPHSLCCILLCYLAIFLNIQLTLLSTWTSHPCEQHQLSRLTLEL